MNYIKRIDELGGAPKAIEKGYIQKEIQNSAYNYQMEVESEERIVVGVNKFQIEEQEHKDILKVDPEVERLQREKLKRLKEERDNKEVENRLEELKNAAGTDKNLMPYILEAVKVYATLGEICGVLREVFGEYQQSVIL
ncbi:methylmalonyl-CoA mutase family protein [Schnuerera ultunensis]|uniref:Methylmalonyl-CoA mutase n=2 Tax=Schnuerera ultunensis TaxID=45497 RepID=A0A1M4PS71_9FIRM